MDFKSLKILVNNKKPFIIAGIGLLNDTSFILDFNQNILAIAPEDPSDLN